MSELGRGIRTRRRPEPDPPPMMPLESELEAMVSGRVSGVV